MSSPPVVAFDVTHTAGDLTGVGRAITETFQALQGAGTSLVPYAWGGQVDAADYPPDTRLIRVPARALIATWGHLGLGKIDRRIRPASVLHATAFVPPATKLPTLVTVYDTTFVAEGADAVQRSWRAPLERALQRGAHVHVNTRTVATEVSVHFAQTLERKRIHVIPFGIPRLPAPEPLPEPTAAQIGGAPYVLAIGTLFARKNIPRLVRAFGMVSEPSLRLVLAGADGSDRPAVDDAIASLDDPSRVVLTGFVPDGVRRTLLQGAAVLAYPSLSEGFGFPILEAMSLGVPVVTSGMGSTYDVAGTAAEFVEPTDTGSIAAALTKVLTDEAHRADLIARGRAHAADFTWERTAHQLTRVYDKLASTSS